MELITREQVLFLMLAFATKHFLADFPLQTYAMLGKFEKFPTYIKPLSKHCLVHAIFTFAIVLMYFAGTKNHMPGVVLGLMAFDFSSHFIIDRIKASPDLLGKYRYLSHAEGKKIKERMQADYPMNKPDGTVIYMTSAERLRIKMADTVKLVHNRLAWIFIGLDQYSHHIVDCLMIYVLLGYTGLIWL